MTSWICQRKPFWIPVGDTFQKAYLEEWQRVDDGSICDPGENSIKTVPCAAASMRQRRAENSDCAIKYEQPLTPHQHRDPHGKQLGNPYLEALRNPGYFRFLGKFGGIIACP